MNRELMVQCLEAFEAVAGPGKKCDAAMAALRAELAQPEPFTPDWAGYRQGKDDALAAFSQEPAAWMNWINDKSLPTFHRTEAAARFWGDNPVPLYLKEQL